MKINLGCGEKKLAGFVNVDICGTPDVTHDLSLFPWPFESESADEIYSEHFLEHVKDYERTVSEIHRILKPGGLLHFKVPHFRSPYTPWHPHLQQFSVLTCLRLCRQYPYVFGGKLLFKDGKVRVNVFLFAFLRRILMFFANMSPQKWDYLGLPIDEIEFSANRI